MIKKVQQLKDEGYELEAMTLVLPIHVMVPDGFTNVNGVAIREENIDLTTKQWSDLKTKQLKKDDSKVS